MKTSGTELLDFDPAGGIGWEAPSTRFSYNAAWGDYDDDDDLDLAFANGTVFWKYMNLIRSRVH